MKDQDTIRKELYSLLTTHIPKSCFAEFMEEKKLNVKVRQPTPKSLAEKANEYQKQDDLSVEDNVTLFTNTLSMSNKEREVVSTNTVGQSSVSEWYEQRKGRLTASKFLQMCNKTEHMQNSSSVDADSLISSLLDYKPAPNTAALKHGRSMEPHAKDSFVSLARKAHYKFKSSEAGLVVMKYKAFIAVSPDLEIECLCCGKGLVETKCPYSIRDTVPTVDNLKYLHTVNEKVQLKQNTE